MVTAILKDQPSGDTKGRNIEKKRSNKALRVGKVRLDGRHQIRFRQMWARQSKDAKPAKIIVAHRTELNLSTVPRNLNLMRTNRY